VERFIGCQENDRYNCYTIGQGGGFDLVIRRKLATRLYVISLVLTPLIIAFLVLLLVLDRFKKPEPDGLGLILGLFAAVLTILPLRPILVPPDITTLTLLDFSLGLDMIVIVAMGVGVYVVMLWKK
jgi:hypothetical protein